MMMIQFLEVRGGAHGGMTFTPTVKVFKFSPTRRNPRRFELWFERPTTSEACDELDRRCDDGWIRSG